MIIIIITIIIIISIIIIIIIIISSSSSSSMVELAPLANEIGNPNPNWNPRQTAEKHVELTKSY